MKIGIIGSAGRKDDWGKFQNMGYYGFKQRASKIWQMVQLISFGGKVTLVSGGAAFIDHISVMIFLQKQPNIDLLLHLPASFDEQQYNEDSSDGKTANFYHRKFSEFRGKNSLSELEKPIASGKARVHFSFRERNEAVAEASDILIAATFGDGPNLKTGGTKHTWDAFNKQLYKQGRYHMDLHDGKIYDKFGFEIVVD